MKALIIGLLLLHIASAAGLIVGIIGRNLALILARRAATLAALDRRMRFANDRLDPACPARGELPPPRDGGRRRPRLAYGRGGVSRATPPATTP